MTTIEQLKEHFETRRDSLVKIAQRRIGDFWAEDAVNDSYEAVIRYAGNKAPVAVMDAYLKYVLGTVLIKYERDEFPDTELEEWMWESGELADEMRGRGILDNVLSDVGMLQEPERSCIFLHVIQGEKAQVVSQIIGESIPNVWKMAERFRKEMREKYGEDQ